MSYLLKIDSHGQTNTHDFSIGYTNFEIEDEPHEIALVKASMWYSWYNIKASYMNHIIAYHNGTSWKADIVIPDGVYDIDQLEEHIHGVMTSNGDTPGNITLVPDLTTLKLKIKVNNSYQLDLSKSLIHNVLGFTAQIITSGGLEVVATGANRVDITNGVNELMLHCSLVDGSFDNGVSSDIIYSKAPDVAPGQLITVDVQQRIYLPLNSQRTITKIRAHITDQRSRVIDLNGEQVSYLFHVRKVK